MHPIHKLTHAELDLATNTIFRAFYAAPIMIWLFGGLENYNKHAPLAIQAWVKWTLLYGVAIATNQCEAVALRKKPGTHHFSFWSMFRSGMLAYPKVLGKEITQRLIQLNQITAMQQHVNMGKEDFWYCWIMAVDPKQQKLGYGSSLMQYTFNLAKHDNLSCYLETATLRNLQIHGQHGFQLISESKIPDSELILYAMVRSHAVNHLQE